MCVYLFVFIHPGERSNLRYFSPGADDYGEVDCVPAQSGSREAFTGRGIVHPTPPHGELQITVERRPGGRLLHHQTQR